MLSNNTPPSFYRILEFFHLKSYDKLGFANLAKAIIASIHRQTEKQDRMITAVALHPQEGVRPYTVTGPIAPCFLKLRGRLAIKNSTQDREDVRNHRAHLQESIVGAGRHPHRAIPSSATQLAFVKASSQGPTQHAVKEKAHGKRR